EVLAILTILVGAALMWKRREIEAWWKALRHPEQITPEAVAEFSHEYQAHEFLHRLEPE
ncbi:MAG: hypothetical protein HYS04_03635, partial [Acidobacteria bacterium]|nr:hypothetical protein [Acidobacteriota bacterium]